MTLPVEERLALEFINADRADLLAEIARLNSDNAQLRMHIEAALGVPPSYFKPERVEEILREALK